MGIIIVRHGEPDNPNQTLTEKGFKEVAALADYYKNTHFDELYFSPLARARITAEALLKDRDLKGIQVDWLEEFHHHVLIPGNEKRVLNWDFKPAFFTSNDDFYNNDLYLDSEVMKSGDVKTFYDEVVSKFDEVLANNGYVREGRYYKVVNENRKTIVFVCHLAVMSVLLSHLMCIPYVLLAQMFCCAPSGVTILTTEEREEGIAQFRCLRYGDITHLLTNNQEPSFHGRFCETFNSDERH